MTKHRHVLEKIINQRKYEKIAELGVFEGATTKHLLSMCPSIKEYYAIDPWHVMGEEFGWRFAHKTRENWDALYKNLVIESLASPSLKVIRLRDLDAVTLFQPSYFDLVYIDSTHFYEDTKKEIQAWMPLVRKGGLLAGHDYGSKNSAHFGVKQAVDELLGAENIKTGRDLTWWKEL